jgi:hypothetical protein
MDWLLGAAMREVRCEACNTLNRVPRYSLRRIPRCGNCHANLPEPAPISAVRALQRIPLGWWLGAACFLGIGLFALSQGSSSVKTSAARTPEPTQCVAQEPLTIGGILRVYDTVNQPVLTHWTINAGYGADYFVKLVELRTGLPKVAYFVRGGQSLTTDVPIGAFAIKHASGKNWCGEQQYFGPGTVFQKGTNTVFFEEDHTYTLYLTPQRKGNFPTTIIPRDQF